MKPRISELYSHGAYTLVHCFSQQMRVKLRQAIYKLLQEIIMIMITILVQAGRVNKNVKSQAQIIKHLAMMVSVVLLTVEGTLKC